MGKIAFVFSGQGAQHIGMAKDFYENFESVKSLFDNAENLRKGTLDMMFSGNEDDLKRTDNTQPCLYLADMAAAIAAKESGIVPDAVAGFSLGEIPALAFSGAYDYENGFSLAVKRGECMGKAAQKISAGMVAALKLPYAEVEQICAHFKAVYPVNYNGGGQLVVAGATEELDGFCNEIKAAGGRAIPLAVGGGFHSPFMNDASEEFGAVLQYFSFSDTQIAAYSNFTGKVYDGDFKNILKNQINHPVKWEDIIQSMVADGFDTFIETGVGETLRKLISKITPESKCYAVNSVETLKTVLEEYKC